jgi:hypothetical protein
MTTYQRLKQENAKLKEQVRRLQILVQKGHFTNEWDKRREQVLANDTPMNKVVFVVIDMTGNFVQMTYIKSKKQVYVDDVFICEDEPKAVFTLESTGDTVNNKLFFKLFVYLENKLYLYRFLDI